MNNHQESTFYPLGIFLNIVLVLLEFLGDINKNRKVIHKPFHTKLKVGIIYRDLCINMDD
jgi:hypothetical protein